MNELNKNSGNSDYEGIYQELYDVTKFTLGSNVDSDRINKIIKKNY